MAKNKASSVGVSHANRGPLQEQAAQFRGLIEQAPDIIYRVRLWPTLAFEYINPAVTLLTGYTPEEHYADPELANRIIHPDDVATLAQMQAGATNNSAEYTVRWIRKDGGILFTHHHCAMLRDETDRVVVIEGIARDVTRVVEAQAALRQQQAIIEAANNAILIRDSAGRLTYWNKGAEQLYGWTAAEATGQDVQQLLVTKFPLPIADIMDVLLSKGHWQGRLVQRTRAGVRIVVHSIWTLQRDSAGQPAAILEIHDDITERVRVEAELQESEARYRDLYDNSPDMYVSVYPESRVIREANRTIAKMLGYTREELVGQPVTMLYDPEFRARHYEVLFRDYLEKGVIENAEVVLRGKDGSRLDALLTVRLVRDADGRPLYSRTVFRDMSARKAIQRQLEASEERLRFALDATSEGVWDWNIQTGEVQYSDQWLRLLGYERNDVPPVVDFWWHILHPDDVAQVTAALQAHLEGRTPMYQCENRLRFKSGEFRYNLDQGKVVEWDAAGRPLRLVGTDTDITARKESERTLARLAAIVESSNDAIISYDLEGNIVSWNHGAERLYQYTAEEAIGQSVAMLIPPALAQDFASLLGRLGSGEPLPDFETQRQAQDGAIIDVALTISPVRSATGELIGASTIARDISERKAMLATLHANQVALEQARDAADTANRAKSLFLASMSHEIRTPMNAVTGLTSLLLDTELTPEQHDYVETIRSSADALLTVINEILDYSKIESNSMELELQPFSLAACIEDALDLFAVPAAAKGIELAYQIAPSVSDTVQGDVTRLRQIIVNLVGNAFKFTEKGEIVIDVRPESGNDAALLPTVHAQSGEGHAILPTVRLHFAVRDTGIGIPKDRLDRLFRSFSQVDASTTRKYGGTGLGLAISKRLAELMGGRMWVESEVGRGSIFHFCVQLQRAPLQPMALEAVDLVGVRVLIVDDNQTNRFILVEQTRRWGMQPTAVEGGPAALALLDAGATFDLVILDMLMPDMNGLEFYAAFCQRTPATLTPAVMLTSLGETFLREEARALGIATFVAKPVRQTQLYDMLCSALQLHSPAARHAKPTDLFDSEFSARHPLHILLAEDNAVNQKVALRVLGRMGYSADVAGNGIEAVESVARQKYDVILMDMHMPEMDGLEATSRIRRDFAPDQQPIIIAMTAAAMLEDRQACVKAGMDDFVSKPIRIEELVHALARASSRSGATHA